MPTVMECYIHRDRFGHEKGAAIAEIGFKKIRSIPMAQILAKSIAMAAVGFDSDDSDILTAKNPLLLQEWHELEVDAGEIFFCTGLCLLKVTPENEISKTKS